MWIIIIAVLGIGLCVWLGLFLARIQTEAIDECFHKKSLADKVECGEATLKSLSNKELFSIKRPMFTVVGMGGMGPRYQPSFSLYCMICDELARRRGDVKIGNPFPA